MSIEIISDTKEAAQWEVARQIWRVHHRSLPSAFNRLCSLITTISVSFRSDLARRWQSLKCIAPRIPVPSGLIGRYISIGPLMSLLPFVSEAQVATRTVTIQYTNLTKGIWFGVAPFVTHSASVRLWTLGKPASLSIRELAEEGNPAYISDAAVAEYGKDFGDSVIGLPALPGQSRVITLTVSAQYPYISGAFMLDQTNDGFAGLDSLDAFTLSGPTTIYVYALDAGTSKNVATKDYLRFLGGFGRIPENGVVHRHAGFAADAAIPAAWRFNPSEPVASVTVTPSS